VPPDRQIARIGNNTQHTELRGQVTEPGCQHRGILSGKLPRHRTQGGGLSPITLLSATPCDRDRSAYPHTPCRIELNDTLGFPRHRCRRCARRACLTRDGRSPWCSDRRPDAALEMSTVRRVSSTLWRVSAKLQPGRTQRPSREDPCGGPASEQSVSGTVHQEFCHCSTLALTLKDPAGGELSRFVATWA
jgi:hypothetical protein